LLVAKGTVVAVEEIELGEDEEEDEDDEA